MHRDDDRVVERLLREPAVRASASFTDDVMLRVSREERTAADISVLAPPFADPAEPFLPWWSRAALEPATLLAFCLAAILAGWPAHVLRASIDFAASAAAIEFSPTAPDWTSWTFLLPLATAASVGIVALSLRGTRSTAAPQPSRIGSRTAR
jgi:hypothetical protein